MKNYADYSSLMTENIAGSLSRMNCQPILFVGSGLSRRYFKAPTWDELLEQMARQCPNIDKDYAYYKQTYSSQIEIGEAFANAYRDWAWGKGKPQFPSTLFSESQQGDIYLKHKVAEYLESISPRKLAGLDTTARTELAAVQQMHPHVVITTNYDRFLETVFPDYEPIIGQQILRASYASVGEILKIHGCVSNPSTLVLTKHDYDLFKRKKKYLSAKMLTYFAEHPMLFVGYSAEDPNIRSILSDISEAISDPEGLTNNLFMLTWKPGLQPSDYPATEHILPLDEGRSIRINSITASTFDWVFKAFSCDTPMEKVNPKLLRALLARSYKLVRHDLPRKAVNIDFETLQHVVTEDGMLPKVLGISTLDDPATFNLTYRFTLTQVGQRMGYKGWHGARKLLLSIRAAKRFDIQTSDNVYHVSVPTGATSIVHKYSQELVDLLIAARDGKPYELNTTPMQLPGSAKALS